MAKQNEVTKGPTGKRYTTEQKQEIYDFLKSKDGERGSISEAMKKFGVSYILIRSIQENPEFQGKGKPGRKPNSESNPGPKPSSNGRKSAFSEGQEKRGRKPGNAAFIRQMLKIRKTQERLAHQIEQMQESLTQG